MTKVRIIKITQMFQSLESIVLLGNRATLLVLLTTVCLSVSSVSNVFAAGTTDVFEEVLQEQDGLARALQTTNVNSANPIMERNLRANGINANTNTSINAVIKEKIPQIVNITKTPTNNAINNLGNNVDLINTSQYNEADLNILPTVNPNEKEQSRKNQGNNTNNSDKVAAETSEINEENKTSESPTIHGQQQMAPEVSKSAVEVTSGETAATTKIITSDNPENQANLTNSLSDTSKQLTSFDSKTVKLAKQTINKEEAKPAVKKIKKTKLTRATKPKKRQSSINKPLVKDADAVDEELDEQYSPETFSQELESSLYSDSSSDKAGTNLFAENAQVTISLSNRDINRISVTNDKIQSINGPAGFYTAKNDPLGSAYVGVNADKNFTLFVSTVKGHQFSLFVTPIASAGKTVVLTSSMPSRITAKWEATEGYQKIIIALISSMINGESLQDYAYVPAKKAKAYNFYGMAHIKPIGYYLGSNLIGSVSVIKNTTKKPLSIKPSSFYMQGVRAVALSDQTLAPMASGLLYQVFDR